ncbi:hypothetical protein NG771_07085 [Aliarcobacter cryaerophilus]
MIVGKSNPIFFAFSNNFFLNSFVFICPIVITAFLQVLKSSSKSSSQAIIS